MLRKTGYEGRSQISMVSLDELVPIDHLVRKIEYAIDFSFIYDMVRDVYCEDNGRPSIDPVVLIKIALIQCLFGIRSMRQTIKEIETNVAYRWFIGYDFSQPIPHFSTLGKNYVRRFRDTGLFEGIFHRILEEAARHGFIEPDVLFIDATHVKASANKNKYVKQIVQEQSRKYQDQLDEEINQDRALHGKKPFEKKPNVTQKEVKVSTTDPECGLFVKGEKERVFAYSFHTACDRNGFVLGVKVTPGNIHDSQVFEDVLHEVTRVVPAPQAVAADAGYKTPAICKMLQEQEIRPVLPYTRPKTKEEFFKKHDYVYDEHYDCYLCPANAILSYETTNRAGYKMYRSNPAICQACPFRTQCTESKEAVKRISRHVWAECVEEADHLRHTEENKRIYAERKETIERVFADLKEKHGMRWTTLRGLKRVTMQAMLVFSAMNLKRMATWLWKRGRPSDKFNFVFEIGIKNLKNSRYCSISRDFVFNLEIPLKGIFFILI
ncbi:transposase [Paenibacillus larvae subsp. larvae]|uniref:Transposase n=2 Tax=Paenibacillus larvae TaxID=1464 RepID=A0A2L1UIP0_9BACL|nr:IS1182 family transposase [Paenibacillus larvae]AQT84508.1 DDE transposase [Paenibacillus larvae subsp. pulvifaciens]AQZ46506.1 IS5/IS1182 family transposase [Paenibacillus larvae subsp. pulvifaciens]AVF28215.1 transposase [Paenibacillus larvae subsp. larvae]AVF32718.1 transposase [Paenibacillus larvae subsp. larvae]MDR5607944.1 IS1182 family transposase [Paenibacillus larvae]